jgi:hypothetical protein
VRAAKGVQFSYRRSGPTDANGMPKPKLSDARARAEAAWRTVVGASAGARS